MRLTVKGTESVQFELKFHQRKSKDDCSHLPDLQTE